MPDPSVPLHWPHAKSRTGRTAANAGAGFVWPTPPYSAYPQPVAQEAPEPCELLGLNNNRSSGHLLGFSREERVAEVTVPPARAAMAIKFNQFRVLKLLAPLPATARDPADKFNPLALDQRPRTSFRLQFVGGGELKGSTIGHKQDDLGLFLFVPPNDEDDAVVRVFVPREALENFELGERIGELLVRDDAATPDQVADAVREQDDLRARRVGEILVANHVVTPEQLVVAIDHQAKMPMVRIGEALLALNLINQSQLNEALAQQRQDRSVPLGELLVRKKVVTRQSLQSALARKMGYPFVDVEKFPVEASAVRRIPYAVAKRLEILPLMMRDGRLIAAMEDPTKRAVLDEAEFVAQVKIVPALTRVGSLQFAIPLIYERFGSTESITRADSSSSLPALTADFEFEKSDKLIETLEREQTTSNAREDDQQIEQSDNSLVRLINTMIMEAHGQGVSDIHIETYPGREKLKIRFRRDGELKPYLELPYNYRNAMIARIKIMCDLDISERRKPQDGKINFSRFSSQHRLELRVATIPTNNGLEDVVMRLLSSAKPMPLPKLGLSPYNLAQLTELIARPYGMVLCVGPTGSGKTTTLHSALAHINTPDRKIWTAEDPVEITQAGLRQVQVNPKIDWTFAKALRAFLRADPDVIMVGEIRDEETAQIAIEASLTGHMVMSTLHTNSAAETITRLLDMGMDPFNFADSLLGVLAQRLVRRLCTQCRVMEPLPDSDLQEWLDDYLHIFAVDQRPVRSAVLKEWQSLHAIDGQLMRFHCPGCAHCEHTGYRGRVALQELLAVNRPIRRLIQTRNRVEEIQYAALADGMRTLRQDGIAKVLAGVTTMAEVRATSNL